MTNRPPLPSARSGQKAAYIKTPAGLTRASYVCQCHGTSFETRTILRMHIKQYHHMVRTKLAEMVKLGNLGQKAWERLPGETPLQYRRFQVYLTTLLPATGQRSTERAAAVVGQQHHIMKVNASRWQWQYRAELFDEHIAAEEFKAYEGEKRKSAMRQAKLGQKLQEAAMAGARKLIGDEDRLAEMGGNEIAKLADVGTKIERLANSDPTAISEDRGQVKLVWEGPKPTWAPEPEAPQLKSAHPPTIDAPRTPLQDRVRAITQPPESDTHA